MSVDIRRTTLCGFCKSIIEYVVQDGLVYVGGSRSTSGIPLFCREECETAWKTGLDAMVGLS